MLTHEQIKKRALFLETIGDVPLFVGGWEEGAIWANEQNAIAYAELSRMHEEVHVKVYEVIRKKSAEIEKLKRTEDTAVRLLTLLEKIIPYAKNGNPVPGKIVLDIQTAIEKYGRTT